MHIAIEHMDSRHQGHQKINSKLMLIHVQKNTMYKNKVHMIHKSYRIQVANGAELKSNLSGHLSEHHYIS